MTCEGSHNCGTVMHMNLAQGRVSACGALFRPGQDISSAENLESNYGRRQQQTSNNAPWLMCVRPKPCCKSVVECDPTPI